MYALQYVAPNDDVEEDTMDIKLSFVALVV
jgi:hypothetical protein